MILALTAAETAEGGGGQILPLLSRAPNSESYSDAWVEVEKVNKFASMALLAFQAFSIENVGHLESPHSPWLSVWMHRRCSRGRVPL